MPASITLARPQKYGKTSSLKGEVQEHLKRVMLAAVAPGFKKMIQAQMQAATGWEEEAPNPTAAKLIMEYVLEKPTQKVEHKGTVGIVHLVAQLEHGDTDEED